jgi:hypothetical protein
MLHCRENIRGVTLIVSGDGDLRSYCFHDFAALLKFETEMSEFLRQMGWSPVQLTVEPPLTSDRQTHRVSSRGSGGLTKASLASPPKRVH